MRNLYQRNYFIFTNMTPNFTIQHYVIRFVGELRQVDGFLRVLRFPPP
jgi:hypothetical protein